MSIPAIRSVSHLLRQSVPDGPTDLRPAGQTDGRTYGRTDKPSFRDAKTHLKNLKVDLMILILSSPFPPVFQLHRVRTSAAKRRAIRDARGPIVLPIRL